MRNGVTIVSLWDWDCGEVIRSYGRFRLPVVQEGQRFGTLFVGDQQERICIRRHQTDPTKDDWTTITTPAADAARDLVKDDLSGRPQLGFFVIEGDRKPTPAELAEAESQMRARLLQLVNETDREWAKNRNPSTIDGRARLAVAKLGLSREWAGITTALDVCPACKQAVPAGAVIHSPGCGAILDPEGAAKFGFTGGEQGPRRQARG